MTHPGAVQSRRVQVADGPSFEVAPDDDCLLRGALRAGIGFPYECSVGGCGTCKFELLAGHVETLWVEAPGLSERERRRGKRLACQSRPTEDCVIKARLDDAYRPDISARRFNARLAGRVLLTHDLCEFVFVSEVAANFEPGQYALFHLPGVGGVRAYSMSNLPNARNEWRFIIRRIAQGKGSTSLWDSCAIGSVLTLDGPYGHAYLRPGACELVCVAGGSGLAPMLSIARAALSTRPRRHVSFYLGLRSQTDLGAAQALSELACPELSVEIVLSAPDASAAWQGSTGFVHEAVARAIRPEQVELDYYFAGPPPMVDAMQTLLVVDRRVEMSRIHFDRYV